MAIRQIIPQIRKREQGFTAISGNDGNTTFLGEFDTSGITSTLIPGDSAKGSERNDQSVVLTANGNAQGDTSQKKWGSASLLLDGNDWIDVADNDFWEPWAGAFTDRCTIDLWVKHSNLAGTQYYMGVDQSFEPANNRWYFRTVFGSGVEFFFRETSQTHISLQGGTISDNDWHHVCYMRDENGNNGLYLDGVQVDYASWSGVENYGISTMAVGAAPDGAGTNGMIGWIDDIRISWDNAFNATPDVGLTSTIQVPTAAHENAGLTMFLMNMDGTNGHTTFVSSSGSFVERINSPDTNIFFPSKFGNAAAHFNGTDEYYFIDQWAGIHFGTGLFTIDWWAWFDAVSRDHGFFGCSDAGNDFLGCYNENVGATDELILDAQDPGGLNISLNSGDWDPVIDTWYHMAIIRGWGGENDVFALTIDGIEVATDTDANTMPSCVDRLSMGFDTTSNYYIEGIMDEFRISKGVARWTRNFTPPALPYV